MIPKLVSIISYLLYIISDASLITLYPNNIFFKKSYFFLSMNTGSVVTLFMVL